MLAVILSMVFLCNTTLYACPVSEDTLRLPLGTAKSTQLQGTRGADIGFITRIQHAFLRIWLEKNKAWSPENRAAEWLAKLKATGRYPNVNVVYSVPDLPVPEHYAIRDGVLYVDRKILEGEHGEACLMHIADKFEAILAFGHQDERFAKYRQDETRLREKLVNWLDEEGPRWEVEKVLVEIYEGATKLPEEIEKIVREKRILADYPDIEGIKETIQALESKLSSLLEERSPYSPVPVEVVSARDQELDIEIKRLTRELEELRTQLRPVRGAADAANKQITRTVITSIVNMYGFVNSQMSPEKELSASKMQDVIDRNPCFKEALSSFIEAKLKLAHLGIFSRGYQEAVERLEPMRKTLENMISDISSDATERELLSKALATADAILTSNLLDPFYDPRDPPALLFDGARLTRNQYPGLQFVAYLPDRTGSFGVMPIIDFKREGAYTAGGFRIVLPGPLEALDGKWKEVYNLAASMDQKSKWSAISTAGSKLEVLLRGVTGDEREKILMQDAPEILIRMTTAGLGLTGFGLFSYNIGGPDVGYLREKGPKQFQPIIDAIQLRCRQYIELEMKLIQAVLTGRIGGIEITPGEETEIILEGERAVRVSNDALLRAHEAFWESPPELAERGQYGIAELSGKGENFRDSREKVRHLYSLDDLALTEYSEVVSLLEDELGVLFPRDPNMYAMREQALQGIRDGAINTAELTISEEVSVIFNKILGVLIGGGEEEKGSLMAIEELSDITAQGVVRAVEHVHEYLEKTDDDVGSVEETTAIVRGAGAVGLPAAERLVRLGYKVTGISDQSGAAYKLGGFTEEDIVALKEAQSRSKFGNTDFVRAAFQDETGNDKQGVTTYNDPDAILWLEADILVPCAIGPTATQENTHKFNVKAIVAGENNMLADRETERMLHERGIMVFEGSSINFGTAYVVVRKEGEIKYRLSPAEIKQQKQAIAKECINEVITSINDLVPIMLALQHKDTTPGDIHRAVIEEITSLMKKVYFDEDGVYAERVEEIIERIRAQGSYMPDHAARSYAAMEIAREDVILQYKQAALAQGDGEGGKTSAEYVAARQKLAESIEIIKNMGEQIRLWVITNRQILAAQGKTELPEYELEYEAWMTVLASIAGEVHLAESTLNNSDTTFSELQKVQARLERLLEELQVSFSSAQAGGRGRLVGGTGDTPITPPRYMEGRYGPEEVLAALRKVQEDVASPSEIGLLTSEFKELIERGRLSDYILELRQRVEQPQETSVALIDKAIEDITVRALLEIFADKDRRPLKIKINCAIRDADEEMRNTTDLKAIATFLELGWLRFDESFSFATHLHGQTNLRVEFTLVPVEERKFNIVAFPGDVLGHLFDSSNRFIEENLDEFKEMLLEMLMPNTILVSVVSDVAQDRKEKLRHKVKLLKETLGVNELIIVFLKKDETFAIDQFNKLPKDKGWIQFYDFSQMTNVSDVIHNRQLIQALATAK